VPVEGEPAGPPEVYGEDRLFVYTRLEKDKESPEVAALERAGHPVVTITLRDTLDLGGEFLRWELATAVAGSILGIDPFDQPNVQESKDNTKRVLAEFEARGQLPPAPALAPAETGAKVAELLAKARRGSYFSIMSYTAQTGASDKALARVRVAVRDQARQATTRGYGPRFLHSTGQLHKGGPRKGIFLQVVQEDGVDVPIPGQGHGFRTLREAQALGDLKSLRSRRLPVVRVDLGPAKGGWKDLVESIEKAVGDSSPPGGGG